LQNFILKEYAVEYVIDKSNKANFRAIMKLPEWKQFAVRDEQLADEIMDAIFDQICLL
jgi:hypothetical protein